MNVAGVGTARMSLPAAGVGVGKSGDFKTGDSSGDCRAAMGAVVLTGGSDVGDVTGCAGAAQPAVIAPARIRQMTFALMRE